MWEGDKLDAAALRAALSGREVVILDETTSTNDVAFKMAANGDRAVVVFAESQTAGRGQRGNRWESAAGKGLLFSMVLKEEITPNESPRVTQWAAEAIATTLKKQFLLRAAVKPPNDVYAGGRKIAGVLLELRAMRNAPHLPVLGIGVNVNHCPEDFSPELRERAGSIAMLTGKQVDRSGLAVRVLEALEDAK